MKSNKPTDVDKLADLLEATYLEMRSRPPESWSNLDLTMTQAKILFHLRLGPLRMSEIAPYVSSSASAVTSMVDRLVNKGLVIRADSTEDRRVVTCRLTDKGQEEVLNVWRIGRMQIEKIASFLSVEDLEVVITGIEKLMVACENANRIDSTSYKTMPASSTLKSY